jgi:hypothetical protein
LFTSIGESASGRMKEEEEVEHDKIMKVADLSKV